MPAFIPMIGGMLLSIVGGLVGKVLASLGLSIVTYYGISQALDFLKGQIIGSLAALPPDVLQVLAVLRVGQALTIMFSALFASMLLNGVTGGDHLKKWILN